MFPSPLTPDPQPQPRTTVHPEADLSPALQKPTLPGIDTIMNQIPLSGTLTVERVSASTSSEDSLQRARKRRRSVSPRQPSSELSESPRSNEGSSMQVSGAATIPRPHPSSSRQSAIPERPFSSGPVGQGGRYFIRTNLKYRRATDTVYACLELPGVQVEDIKLTLTVNSSGQKTLDVSAVVHPPVVEQGEFIREERIHGKMTRSFVVPNHICARDIHTDLKDGLFYIEIRGTHSEAVAVKRESLSPTSRG